MSECTPLVSVVMPAYNALDTLSGAMQSVLVQSMSDLELIVIDDASTDDTLMAARRIAAEDRRVRVLTSIVNGGAAEARNIGIDAARGTFIAFLDSDDQWLSQKLERQLPLFADPSVVLVGSAYRTMDPNGKIVGGVAAIEYLDLRKLLAGAVFGCLTSIFRSAAVGNTVRFRPSSKRARGSLGRLLGWRPIQEDYLFWFDLFSANPGSIARSVCDPLALYMLRPGSASAAKHRAAYFHWQILRHDIALSCFDASCYFLQYAIAALFKNLQYRRGEQAY